MNVFVVEDAPQVRSRLVALLQAVAGVQVVGEADTVRSAVAGILDTSPDAVLLDLQLLDGNGLDVLAAVKPQRPDMHVVVLSNFATPQYRDASLAAGAEVFLDKSHDFARLPSILQGWLPPRRGGVPAWQSHQSR
ncbi:MAG: response regulator transcription factor [Rubrivivax sp.]|nr:response regulator transcription factor [Rubrivivax sp.]